MHLPFRDYHLIQILEAYDPERGPLDRYLHLYFRANKALGSSDRRAISQEVYDIVRWSPLLRSRYPHASIEDLLKNYRTPDFPGDVGDLPEWAQCSCPEPLFELLSKSFSVSERRALCHSNNQQAPVTIRANTLKTSRDALLKRLSENFKVSACQHSPWGIRFDERAALFTHPTFQEGLFEMQDEGSQLLAAEVRATAEQQVLDYCAGSGGKSLAIAPAMQGKGQLYLHDIRQEALQEARKRLKRAGIQNAQCLSQVPKRLKKRMDWVLVDAPCSGTGTLRRNPDMKTRITEDFVKELIGKQRRIFEQALSFLAPEGFIVYATCSVLKQENEEQVAHFCKCYDLNVIGTPFATVPQPGGMDGFFATTFQRS